MNRTEPPSGVTPPQTFGLADGTTIDLGPLAEALSNEYFERYPEDLERYAPAARAWCDHDTRYLLAWALEDARAGTVDCVEQVLWLGRVLAGRSYPIDHLVAHVRLVAIALRIPELGDTGARASERIDQAADALALRLTTADDGATG